MFHRFEEIFRKFYINHKNGPLSRNEKKIELSRLNLLLSLEKELVLNEFCISREGQFGKKS